jgi:hypothetical protein
VTTLKSFWRGKLPCLNRFSGINDPA